MLFKVIWSSRKKALTTGRLGSGKVNILYSEFDIEVYGRRSNDLGNFTICTVSSGKPIEELESFVGVREDNCETELSPMRLLDAFAYEYFN